MDDAISATVACKLTAQKIMKTLEKLTLATATAATAAAAGFCIVQYLRIRTERLFRLAAGESPYERKHPKQHHVEAA